MGDVVEVNMAGAQSVIEVVAVIGHVVGNRRDLGLGGGVV